MELAQAWLWAKSSSKWNLRGLETVSLYVLKLMIRKVPNFLNLSVRTWVKAVGGPLNRHATSPHQMEPVRGSAFWVPAWALQSPG